MWPAAFSAPEPVRPLALNETFPAQSHSHDICVRFANLFMINIYDQKQSYKLPKKCGRCFSLFWPPSSPPMALLPPSRWVCICICILILICICVCICILVSFVFVFVCRRCIKEGPRWKELPVISSFLPGCSYHPIIIIQSLSSNHYHPIIQTSNDPKIMIQSSNHPKIKRLWSNS